MCTVLCKKNNNLHKTAKQESIYKHNVHNKHKFAQTAKQESINVHNSAKPQQVTCCRLSEEAQLTISAAKPHINK